MNFDRLGGRRFLLTCATLASATLLCYVGRLDSGSYAAVMSAVVAVYISGNTVQKWVESKAADPKPEQK